MAINSTNDDRKDYREGELETQIPDDIDWATQEMPNRLNKVRKQYDRGIITDDEFMSGVTTMYLLGGDIDAD